MTKIGLLSDTHGYVPPRVYEHFADCDEVWHAGDIGTVAVLDELRAFKPLRIVFGNIDNHIIRLDTPEDLVFQVEEVKVAMTHIAGRPGKYSPKAFDLLTKERPKIFVCGHSHTLLVQFDKKMNALWLNPGACGKKGFHKVCTVLRFEIDGADIKNIEVIELENRG